MKHIIYKSIVIALSVGICCSCKPNLTAPAPSKGSVSPTRYVAIGNSITSGYADGALSYEGQMNSYPYIIAQQLKLIGGGNFNQPLVNQSSIGVGMPPTYGAPFKLGYSTDCLGVNSLGPIPTATVGDMSIFSTNIFTSQGPFNNMGVPGAKAITVVASGYGNLPNGNPFFTRMASNPATASILSDAEAINPTFFSMFIGNNDVLAYAMNGGALDSITPSAGVVGVGFDASILAITNTLTANGAKGVIGNIPDITSLPFFTTVPWNGLALTRQSEADSLNGAWPGLNFNFHVGNNAFLIADATVPYIGLRQIQEGELILLNVPLDSIKCHKMGTLIPIPNQHVLTANEIINIQTATIAYNQTIKSVAQLKGLAFVDVETFLNQAKSGINYNGVTLNAQFVTGGVFSLDGIHLNPIGNALLANQCIKAINATYGSTIPQVDVTNYRGVVFP
jgi:hypothetical protein